MKQVNGQMSLFDLDMPCGKMFPAHSAATKARISASSSKNFVKSQTAQSLFLDLRKGSGRIADVSWEMDFPLRGASSTLVFGESPKDAEESGLSQILEDNVPLKYYLSERACLGVLRRAEKRGKKLPDILETALKQQIERWRKCGSPLPPNFLTSEAIGFDGYNSVLTGNESSTLGVNCRMSSGRTGVLSKCAAFLANPSAKARGIAFGEDSPCLRVGETPSCVIGVVYDARGNGDGKTVNTITGDHNNRITDYSQLVCEKVYIIDPLSSNSMKSSNPHVDCTMRVRCGKEGGGKGALVQNNASGTLGCNNDQVLFQAFPPTYIVRRLTPLECCRLQGFPDLWTDGTNGSDSAKYKMWGNGMALPNALFIMEGIAEIGENNGKNKDELEH